MKSQVILNLGHLFQSILEQSSDFFYVKSVKDRSFLYVSQGFSELVGIEGAQILNGNGEGLPENLDEILLNIEDSVIREGQEKSQFKLDIYLGNQLTFLTIEYLLIKDQKAKPLYLVGIGQERVNEGLKSDKLVNDLKRFEEIEASGEIGTWYFDVERQKITWSDQMFEIGRAHV